MTTPIPIKNALVLYEFTRFIDCPKCRVSFQYTTENAEPNGWFEVDKQGYELEENVIIKAIRHPSSITIYVKYPSFDHYLKGIFRIKFCADHKPLLKDHEIIGAEL